MSNRPRHKRLSAAAQVRVERELRGEPDPPRHYEPVPDGFITTKEALEMIGASGTAGTTITPLPHKVAPARAISGRRPLLYERRHIERVAALRRVAQLGLEAAVRVVVAEIDGRLPKPCE